MEPLDRLLRRELAETGFCQSLFAKLEAACVERLRDGAGTDYLTATKLFVLAELCSRIQVRLENNPTTAYHQALETALLAMLTATVAGLETGESGLPALRQLIDGIAAAPR